MENKLAWRLNDLLLSIIRTLGTILIMVLIGFGFNFFNVFYKQFEI